MTQATDTTGQVVMHHTEMSTRTVISKDAGWYEGTRPELNIRKLQHVEDFNLSITDPAVRAIWDNGSAYGGSWGGSTKLVAVTDADIETLRAAVVAQLAARPVSQPAAPEWRSPRGKTLTEEMDSADSIY